MRDNFEGVNFLAGKRTWKYKARKKRDKKEKDRRDGRGLSFINEDPGFNDWNGLPVTQRHKKRKRGKGETEEDFFCNEEPLLDRLE
ncbi:hypothetical protein AVEN_70667-1 [Araneus ventricosus]|uniref:Uncharacterized protein n=1 Tax=Araneus ventricosus TaxID=182803 RepID=A0A4Y2VQP5_ARAVE|nr:hypothetical protein AVEN_70667-1 [Araneus ventricosus]